MHRSYSTIATNLFNIFIKVDEAPIAYKSQMHPMILHGYIHTFKTKPSATADKR